MTTEIQPAVRHGIKDRLEEVSSMVHVKEWIRDFEEVVKNMPKEVWVFVAGGPNVMVLDERRREYMRSNGCVDPNAILERVRGGRWDGGDW